MTADEAKTIAAIISEVDGSCSVCVKDAGMQMQKAFPDFDWRTLIVTACPYLDERMSAWGRND